MFTVGGNVATLYNQTTATQSHGIPRNKPLIIMKYDANANNQAAFDGICCDVVDDLNTTHDYVYYSTAFSLNPDITTLTAADSYHLDKSVYQEVDERLFTVTNNGLTFPVAPYEHWYKSDLYGYVIPKSAYSAQDLYVYVYEKDISETSGTYEYWITSGDERVPVSGSDQLWTVTQSGNNSAALCLSRYSYVSPSAPIDRKYKSEHLDSIVYTNVTAIENLSNAGSPLSFRSPASTSAFTFFNEFTQEYETSSIRVSNVNTQVIDHIQNTNSPYYLSTDGGSMSFWVRTYVDRIETTTAVMSVRLPVFQYRKDATMQNMRTIALYDVNSSACYVKSCDNSNITAHDIQFSSVSNSTLKMSKHTYGPHPQVRDALPKNVYNSTISYSSNFNNSDLDGCKIEDSTVDLVSAYFYDAVQPASTITLTNLTANNSYINGTYYEAYTGDLTVNL
jgi:hypothetical protein